MLGGPRPLIPDGVGGEEAYTCLDESFRSMR